MGDDDDNDEDRYVDGNDGDYDVDNNNDNNNNEDTCVFTELVIGDVIYGINSVVSYDENLFYDDYFLSAYISTILDASSTPHVIENNYYPSIQDT